MHFGADGKLYVGGRRQRRRRQRAGPGRAVRQDAALQRRRHDPGRQPVLHARRPGCAARSGPTACATRSPSRCSRAPAACTSTTSAQGTWEEINLGAAGRQLRLAGLRRARQRRRRHHRRRCLPTNTARHPAGLGPGRLLHRLRDRRRRVLPGQRRLPGRLTAAATSSPTTCSQLGRPPRPAQRQRGLCLRRRHGRAGRHAASAPTARCMC